MTAYDQALIDRKLGHLRRFVADMKEYAAMDDGARRRQHYAIERLLQLLCEASADIGLHVLKTKGRTLPSSYREIFSGLVDDGELPQEMAAELIAACGMRNVLTRLYDTIDMDRVMAAVDPAVTLYTAYLRWALSRFVDRYDAPAS
jgi:uncharacterized protein YutE (UPF0331/DUF86 family)